MVIVTIVDRRSSNNLCPPNYTYPPQKRGIEWDIFDHRNTIKQKSLSTQTSTRLQLTWGVQNEEQLPMGGTGHKEEVVQIPIKIVQNRWETFQILAGGGLEMRMEV